ncbi:MAG TPA: helix-turn-helix domain-containing protein [Balneolaceae bacterium]|nr:helix-turn-helix domain-containing protein [Balneolaceae bacterium]
MSKNQNSFTESEQIRIAKQAVAGGTEDLKRLAEENNISQQQIQDWIREYNIEAPGDISDDVSLEASENFVDSVEYGATFDNLNYNRLTFWSVFGTSVILIFIISIMFIHEYTRTSALQRSDESSLYYEINELQEQDKETLETFGVVDPEEGIYRVPIDSAITIMTNE